VRPTPKGIKGCAYTTRTKKHFSQASSLPMFFRRVKIAFPPSQETLASSLARPRKRSMEHTRQPFKGLPDFLNGEKVFGVFTVLTCQKTGDLRCTGVLHVSIIGKGFINVCGSYRRQWNFIFGKKERTNTDNFLSIQERGVLGPNGKRIYLTIPNNLCIFIVMLGIIYEQRISCDRRRV